MSDYKIILFGVKDTSENMAEYIHNELLKVDLVVTVSSDVQSRNDISGFKGLDSLTEKFKIPIFKADSYGLDDERTRTFFKENTFDLGIVTGWQRLIPKYVLDSFRKGIFGFHGSAGYLPFGRGRSPLNWSILSGDSRFNLNLFRYDEKADSPNVFATKMFSITPHDSIRTTQYKNQICSKEMIKELIASYKEVRNTDKEIPVKTSSKDFDSWYKKRTPDDGRIDWKMRTREIYNLIRAVSEPFPCAFTYTENEALENKIIIRLAHPFDEIMDFSDYAPGEIIDIFDNKAIVRTVDGSLIIENYESKLPLKKGLLLI